MVEVFKTNVKDRDHANILIDQLHQTFAGYKASFDLEDCDHILRIECLMGWPNVSSVIRLLARFGYQADLLPDDECAPGPVGTAATGPPLASASHTG
jgi:hypothetical protein